MFGARPINQKKVTAVQVEEGRKKSDIGPVGNGMQKFMRQETA